MNYQASQHPSSYRDPSGFVFWKQGILYRQVNLSFKEHYDLFISSGLYDHLVKKNLLVPHEETDQNLAGSLCYYKTLRPEIIPFLSYPFEWCFDMLKDAALLTLQLAKEALTFGMILKDASAYNVQFKNGRPLFIDSLSFERYDEQKPWIAYRQFCEHFYAPLALMHFLKYPLQSLLLSYPEGIPLELAARLLPWKSRFNLGANLHILVHARISINTKGRTPAKQVRFSRQKMQNLLEHLESSICSFNLDQPSGTWSGYYNEAFERNNYIIEKESVLSSWLSELKDVTSALDAGANEGYFSRLLAKNDIATISADTDHFSVNNLYGQVKKEQISILPLLADFSNPAPAIGVNNEERASFRERIRTDLVTALALIHHLAIGKNIPFTSIAKGFAVTAPWLIIEFVPKEDEKIKEMLSQKEDVYDWYTEENFQASFTSLFTLVRREPIKGSGRTLYLFKSVTGSK